jgi:hypothetical protein
MKLNELIEIEGLESVSEKTNISIYNLDSLARGDFKELNRVKALGFVHILKREYGANVDELETSIKSYFEDNAPKSDEPVLVSPDKLKQSSGFSKWIVIIALLSGLWYLYNSGKLDGLLNASSNKKDNILNDNEALKSKNNISEDDVKKSIIIKKENNDTKIEIQTVKSDSNMSIDANGTVKVIADIPKENNATDGNQTILINSEAGIEEPVLNTPTPDKNATEITNITINPTRGMLWYGIINIKTGKKKEYMKKNSTPFDLKGEKWILTTGHGYLDIVSDVKTVEIADKRRHYFYIDKKEIKEITRKEFRRLNHGRIW